MKEKFLAYEAVRKSGKYNMIMDSSKAMIEAGLNFHDYAYIIHNYSKLAEKYL